MEELKPGLIGEAEMVVTEQVTAASAGSGLVPVFATPWMIALMENASVNAIQKCFAAGQTSVGIHVSISHLAATPIGMRVRARAQVTAVEGRRVSLQVEAWDEKEKIGEGTHVRAVIDEKKFMDKVAQKK
jgi:fluoroacetyl-CoA thioesterase